MNLPLALILSNDAQRRYFAEGQTGAVSAHGRRKVARRRRRAQVD
jgi:hypothetical protein